MTLRALFSCTVLSKLGLILCVGLPASCYFESVDDRSKSATDKDSVDQHGYLSKDGCRMDYRSGCFEGQIPASPEIYVDGKLFMDVNDLANRFTELLNVESLEGQLSEGDDYVFKLVTALDNKTFAKGFEVYLKGDYSKTARVMMSGQFGFDKLPDGEYMVRVQRPLRFNLERMVTKEGENGEEVAEKVVREICATLYSDVPVDVRLGERSRYVFDEFQLYVTDTECVESTISGPISL